MNRSAETQEAAARDASRDQRNFRSANALITAAITNGYMKAAGRAKSWLNERLRGQSELQWRELSFLKRILLVEIRDQAILKHIETLSRKRAQAIFIDEYGHVVLDKWRSEISYFVDRALVQEIAAGWRAISGDSIADDPDVAPWLAGGLDRRSDEYEEWIDAVDIVVRAHEGSTKASTRFNEGMKGDEYERFVVGLLQQVGWTCRLTPATGDHGVDIIAEYQQVRVALQCKRYVGNVGNESVQQVYSGAEYHACALACVVSNSNYTPAARQAANKLRVELLHHDEIDAHFGKLSRAIDAAAALHEKAKYRSPHDVLDISLDASKADIEQAYRQKVPLYHPDKLATMGKELQEQAAMKMKELNWAREECLRIAHAAREG